VPAQLPDDDAGDFTLRQLVERFAAENGLTFMPKYGRSMAGLQVPSSPLSMEKNCVCSLHDAEGSLERTASKECKRLPAPHHICLLSVCPV